MQSFHVDTLVYPDLAIERSFHGLSRQRSKYILRAWAALWIVVDGDETISLLNWAACNDLVIT